MLRCTRCSNWDARGSVRSSKWTASNDDLSCNFSASSDFPPPMERSQLRLTKLYRIKNMTHPSVEGKKINISKVRQMLAGIGIAAALGALLLFTFVFWLLRRRRSKGTKMATTYEINTQEEHNGICELDDGINKQSPVELSTTRDH